MSQFSPMFCRATKVRLPMGTEVQNVRGTTSCRSFGYDSWKQLYEGVVGYWPDVCPVNYCSRNAIYGAHVRLDFNRGGVWIIPMCAKHNHYTNNDWMPINSNTIAVYAEEEHTWSLSEIEFGFRQYTVYKWMYCLYRCRSDESLIRLLSNHVNIFRSNIITVQL